MEGVNGQLKAPGKVWDEVYALETKLCMCSWQVFQMLKNWYVSPASPDGLLTVYEEFGYTSPVPQCFSVPKEKLCSRSKIASQDA